MFEILRIFLNQGWKRYICFLVNIWALISVIFTSCLSGGVLSTILLQDMTAINSFAELMSSNMRIICLNNSFIYFGIEYAEEWNDDKLKRLKYTNKVDYFVHES